MRGGSGLRRYAGSGAAGATGPNLAGMLGNVARPTGARRVGGVSGVGAYSAPALKKP